MSKNKSSVAAHAEHFSPYKLIGGVVRLASKPVATPAPVALTVTNMSTTNIDSARKIANDALDAAAVITNGGIPTQTMINNAVDAANVTVTAAIALDPKGTNVAPSDQGYGLAQKISQFASTAATFAQTPTAALTPQIWNNIADNVNHAAATLLIATNKAVDAANTAHANWVAAQTTAPTTTSAPTDTPSATPSAPTDTHAPTAGPPPITDVQIGLYIGIGVLILIILIIIIVMIARR